MLTIQKTITETNKTSTCMKNQFKLLTLAASAAMLFAACSSDKLESYAGQPDLNPEAPSNAIQFGTYMGRTTTTRTYGDGTYTSGPISNDGDYKLQNAQFGVFGYYSGSTAFGSWSSWAAGTTEANQAPNFMYNQQIVWDATNNYWKYTPVKYWPNGIDAANAENNPSNTATEDNTSYAGEKLSFFAYAPYVAHTTTTTTTSDDATQTAATVAKAVTTAETNGIVKMSKNDETADMKVKYQFLSGADENSAVDLLWGLRGQLTYSETDDVDNTKSTLGTDYNVDLTKQIVGDKVKFLFKHALARLGGSTSSSTAAGPNQICGVKVVLDVDNNSSSSLSGSDNQNAYLGSNFDISKTKVTISQIKIRDKYTYSHESTSSISETTSDFQTYGWFDIMAGKWVTSGTDVSTTTGSKGVIYDITVPSGSYTLNSKIAEPSGYSTASTVQGDITSGAWTNTSDVPGVKANEIQNVYGDVNIPALLLIPGTSGTNTLYVTVHYFVRTADENLANRYTEVEQEITNKVTLDNSLLNPNKYYTLVMHLGLTSVKFEAVVADWSSTSDNFDEGGAVSGDTEVGTSVWLPSNVVSYASSQNVSSNAANTTLNLTDYASFGTYDSETHDGNVSAVSVTTGTATITLTPNLTNAPVESKVTFKSTTGNSIVLTITQAADATFTLSVPATLPKAGTATDLFTVSPATAVTISGITGTATDLTITATDADDNGTYDVNVTGADNSTGAAKDYEITLTISGSDSKSYIYKTTITQAAE